MHKSYHWIKSYPENVLESIFGKYRWTKVEETREEVIAEVEKIFEGFLQEENAREDKDDEEKAYFEPALLQRFYDLFFKEFKTVEEVANEMGMPCEETHRMYAFMLRKLRYPSRSRQLKKYITED